MEITFVSAFALTFNICCSCSHLYRTAMFHKKYPVFMLTIYNFVNPKPILIFLAQLYSINSNKMCFFLITIVFYIHLRHLRSVSLYMCRPILSFLLPCRPMLPEMKMSIILYIRQATKCDQFHNAQRQIQTKSKTTDKTTDTVRTSVQCIFC